MGVIAATESLPDTAKAMRLVSAGAEEAMARFADPELLAAGKVNVISLEAVEARFGARWGLRADQVYDFTTRVLERGVGEDGFYLRVSATDFFIVQPERNAIAGQAACLRYLREVLNHFLGEDGMAASSVFQVTKIADGRLEAAGLHEGVESLADQPEAPPAAPERSVQESADQWNPFVAADGRRLRVSATLEPVYEVKGFTRIGFRMVRRVMAMPCFGRAEEEELPWQQVSRLPTADLLRIDLATIARGVDRLRAEAGVEQMLSLIVPLSFVSLSSQRGRTELVKQLKEAGGLVRLGVICEICDIEGVPPSALLSAVSLVRPFAVLVAGRLMDVSPHVIFRLQGGGLQALSFECPPGLGGAEFIGWAHTTIAAARRVTRAVMVYRAGSSQQTGALASLGASHVSVTAG